MITDEQWLAAEQELRRDGLWVNKDGSVVCKHRDVSCCRECAARHDSVIVVGGLEMFEPDPDERKALSA